MKSTGLRDLGEVIAHLTQLMPEPVDTVNRHELVKVRNDLIKAQDDIGEEMAALEESSQRLTDRVKALERENNKLQAGISRRRKQ